MCKRRRQHTRHPRAVAVSGAVAGVREFRGVGLHAAWCTVRAVRAYFTTACAVRIDKLFTARALLPFAAREKLGAYPSTHKASTVHHHAIVHGVVRKPRYQGVRGHSLTRAASRGLCAHHQAIVRAPDGLSYQVWQRSTIRQPRASLNSARSCASDMRRGPGPKESSCIPCARYSDVWLHHVKLAV